MKAPSWLHDVLGEEPSAAEIAAILAFAIPAATVSLALARPQVAPWRVALAWLLLADIAAGCVANFTRSTNDFYAARPRNRWLFIAVHVHLPVFAWLVGTPASSAWCVAAAWCFTIAAASIVNALAGRATQVFVGGLLLSIGLAAIAAMPVTALVRVAAALFLTKVAYSFAVDHFRSVEPRSDGVASLELREHDAAVSIIARAFATDPLFVATCGADHRRRVALASFLIDMTRLSGGALRARSSGGRLVAVSLVDRPASARAGFASDALVLARFAPALLALGVPAAVLLNDYFVRTRRALAADSAYLALLAVDPDAQGRGFGGELIDDAIALGRSSGARAIGLDTENRANVTLYQRYGFSLDRELSLEAMPVFVMSCPLPASPTPAAR